jgi:hypothetical protein
VCHIKIRGDPRQLAAEAAGSGQPELVFEHQPVVRIPVLIFWDSKRQLRILKKIECLEMTSLHNMMLNGTGQWVKRFDGSIHPQKPPSGQLKDTEKDQPNEERRTVMMELGRLYAQSNEFNGKYSIGNISAVSSAKEYILILIVMLDLQTPYGQVAVQCRQSFA